MRSEDHDRVQRWVELPARAETVWREIGGFDQMHTWHPWIESSELLDIEGEPYRHLRLTDGALFLEKLITTGDHFYTYATIEGSMPFDDHRATLSCVAEEDGCRVFWSAYFEPTDPAADDMVVGFYEAGLEAVRERFAP